MVIRTKKLYNKERKKQKRKEFEEISFIVTYCEFK